MTKHNEFMPRSTRASVCPIRTAAERLAQERQQLGITSALVQAASRRDTNQVGAVLARMERQGKLFGAYVAGHVKHWFVSAEAARGWLLATPSKQIAAAHPQAFAVRPSVPAPGQLKPSARTGEPIITDRTRFTRDTRQWPTARWQMRQEAPDERWPSFAASRPGIDPSTGKPWGASA